MNGIQNEKAHNLEKPFPGCLRRMVNLFDLDVGVTRNRLLTEKGDGSFLVRSRSDVTKMLNPIGDSTEDKPIESELTRSSSNKKSNGTPMKMLIAEEMSKEMESRKQPSVVAKLMGLDALPGNQPNFSAQRAKKKCHPQIGYPQPMTPLRYQQQHSGILDMQMECEIHPFQEEKVYKDVYEVQQQSSRTRDIIDKSVQKGGFNKHQSEGKMALVRQKFIEAKRLATDENLRHSKEFQDALEVLSSNKGLFLKFLQEPNSMLSQKLYELQSIPPPPQTKRITILRPSKTLQNNRFSGPENKIKQQMSKQAQAVEGHGSDKREPAQDPALINHITDNSSQPTRIVVLKPSLGKTHDIRAVGLSPSSSPRILHNKDFCVVSEDDKAQESREVANDITQHMSENLSSHGRDETCLTSSFSNGYVGDESSFHRSENECMEGDISDLEIMTPTSRHSSDYINRFGSPFSSSFSHASFSPESSVCREAKKRLSERWALMALNGNDNEQRRVRRSSSTLGEMLALSDTKKSILHGQEGDDGELGISSGRFCGGELDVGEQTSHLTDTNKDEGGDGSPRNLLRSRSLPVSKTACQTGLNVEVPDLEDGKSTMTQESMKSKSRKSSFKGKVSSLFFSRKKKSCKEKSVASPLSGSKDDSQTIIAKIHGVPEQAYPLNKSDAVPQCAANSVLEGALSPALEGASNKISSSSICVEPKQGTVSHEAGLSLAKPEMAGNPGESQDQPSPISVLEALFEDDANATLQSSGICKSNHQGIPVDVQCPISNLIDKSPPIESLSRTLSWDDAFSETATSNPLNTSTCPPKVEEEEQESFMFVQRLLSAAGLDNGGMANAHMDKWHSPESPLDPSLMDRCFNLKDHKGLLHEAKHKQWRSNRKLLFDSVNVALVDIYGCQSDANPWTEASSRSLRRLSVGKSVTVDQVWDRIKEWSSSNSKCSHEGGDRNTLVVEEVLRKEVVWRGWAELMRLETDGIGKELEGKMLEELLEEAVVELAGGLC